MGVLSRKKVAECVYHLTIIADAMVGCFPDIFSTSADELFEKIYDLALEFEDGYPDEGNYLEDIQRYGVSRLSAYFGLSEDELPGWFRGEGEKSAETDTESS